MPKLSPTNWQTQVKIFEEFGCVYVRQKGDHLIYHHPNARRAAGRHVCSILKQSLRVC